ncbi:MAG TPA: hypothetical protein VHZ73_06475, partial [Vicinamibacterales bacterium]|nr:hypothetical protein [Vicinamibacterales bacterium]
MPLGIELSSTSCRIVDLDRSSGWRRAGGTVRVRGVRAWAQGPAGSLAFADTPAMLAAFRGRQASVVLWNARTDHRVLSVHAGRYDRMRIEARARVREVGLPLDNVLSDIAPASARTAEAGRQDVMLASAPTAEVAAAIAPVIAAGIKIRAVLTPAAALQSLARLRAAAVGSTVSPGIEAWIALHETSACIAILRGGQLIDAHDLLWGFLDELSDFQSERDRYDIAVRLADELSAFLVMRRFDAPVAQVFICSAMPELRSMSVQMMDRLDIEVEPLDSLFGIDERHLPGSADTFHDTVSGLRLAWAAARNSRPALDLYRARRRRATKTYLSRAAVFAGAAAGLSVGWAIERELPAVAAARAVVLTVPEPSPIAVENETAKEPAPLASRTIAAPAGMLIATMIPAPLPVPASQLDDRAAAAAPVPPPSRPWESVPPLTGAAHVIPV